MSFQDKLKKTVSKGLEQSKSIFSAAKDKAKDLGDSGILRFEIHQLEDKIKKQEQALGHALFEVFSVEGKQSVTKRSAGIKEILESLDDLNMQLTGKRVALSDVESQEEDSAPKDAGSSTKPDSSREE